MNEMIERVARAINPQAWEAEGLLWEHERRAARKSARDAIGSMRIASLDMERAAQKFIKPYHDIEPYDWANKTPRDMFRLAWRAMIDAALAAAPQDDDSAGGGNAE